MVPLTSHSATDFAHCWVKALYTAVGKKKIQSKVKVLCTYKVFLSSHVDASSNSSALITCLYRSWEPGEGGGGAARPAARGLRTQKGSGAQGEGAAPAQRTVGGACRRNCAIAGIDIETRTKPVKPLLFHSNIGGCLCSPKNKWEALSTSQLECQWTQHKRGLACVAVSIPSGFVGCLSPVIASSANSMPLDPLRIVGWIDSWNRRSEVNWQSFILLELVQCVTSITVTRQKKKEKERKHVFPC